MLKRSAGMLLLGLSLFVAVHAAQASEAWVFRFDSRSGPSGTTSWHDDLSFHNTTDQVAVVQLLGFSEGSSTPGDVLEVPVEVGRTLSLSDVPGLWSVNSASGLWVIRFDVPDGVLVSSRGGAHSECPSPCGQPPNPLPDLGTFTMPVFRSLAPAGSRQFHMGTDLGTQPSRSNVGIYNAGTVAANATLSLYRACDDALLESRSVVVPANFAVQVGVSGAAPGPCADTARINVWLRYAVVAVDQPSITYVFNVAEDLPIFPHVPFGLAGF